MSNKMAIVLGCNIHWAPYYFRYEKMLIEKNVHFDLIIWDREGLHEEVQANEVFRFCLSDTSCNNNPKKVVKFFKFARFVKKKVKQNKYEKLFFLGFQGCALTLNASFFSKKYKNRYWIDIRDYHYEWFKPYFLLEKKVIQNAFDVAISSDGFRSFLPEYQYLNIHNVDPNMDRILKDYSPSSSQSIRISFIGNVRYLDENKRLLSLLGNDKRYKLQYYGAGSEEIEEYCRTAHITNVDFCGRFLQSETVVFYNKTDIINNVYGNTTKEVTTALSNKLYYSICLKMPILVSPQTFMEEYCKDYGFGFSFNCKESFADDLYVWYTRLSSKSMKTIYDSAWEKIELEEQKTNARIIEFIGVNR